VDNIPRWTSLTDEYRQVEIPIAEATERRKDLWLTSLNCGCLSVVNSHKKINKAKLTSICWQFQRCGSDVMYLIDTRLNQVQGQRAIEFMRTLLPHGIPGTLAKGLAGAHFGEKNQITLKNNAVER
jgi:hypothetical protein